MKLFTKINNINLYVKYYNIKYTLFRLFLKVL